MNDSFWTQFGESSPLRTFDAAQASALMQLLIAATFVDYQVSHAERDALVRAIDALPQFDEHQWASLAGEEGLDVITKIGLKFMDPDRREAFLETVAEHFTDPIQARAAFDAVVAILHCDGLDGSEFAFCLEIGARLGLSDDDIRVIVGEAWAVRDPGG